MLELIDDALIEWQEKKMRIYPEKKILKKCPGTHTRYMTTIN